MKPDKMLITFGEQLRGLREERSLTLNNVSEYVGIDPSLLAKIERNQRRPSKRLIQLIAEFYHCDEQELFNQYLSDQIAYKVINEDADLNILKVAEQKVKYLKSLKNG